MTVPSDDWRRMGQEEFLPPGTELVRKSYRVYRDDWDHDHCEFCGAKFMDPYHSKAHGEAAAADPEILTEGYATTDTDPRGAEYHWICPACFDDFNHEFGWVVEVRPSS